MSAEKKRQVIMHLTFEEGEGTKVRDASGHLLEIGIQYRHLNPKYTGKKDPQWRKTGVNGASLLFDGSSTAIVYPPEWIVLSGSALTISAWIAPRAFEWERYDVEGRDDAPLTTLVSQFDLERHSGILFGFHRFGRLCLQFGTGDGWYAVWAKEARLKRLAWNHVAAVFDGETGKVSLYLNGELVGAKRIPVGSRVVPAAGEPLMIGKNPHAEHILHGMFNMFAGLMSDLRIETAAVDAEELRAQASQPMPQIDYADIGLENTLTDDCQKTQYHGGPYQHWMNEPHAPLYYNGMYHLFFQSNSFGPYWRGICWGHLLSEDTVRWRPVRDAIVPMEHSVAPDGIWSGGATLDVNGMPVLFFTAANYRFAEAGLISNQNIGAAYPADPSDPELTDWIVLDALAVVQQPGQGRPGEFRDAHVWQEDGVWNMVVCGGSSQTSGGTALLYTTDLLEVRPGVGIEMNWRYRGPVYEMQDPPAIYGTSWELPVLLPIQNRAGTIRRHAFFFLPAPPETADNKVYYFVGEFDRKTGRFVPDAAFYDRPRMLDYGDNVFTGPSALIDPVTGRICLFSIMQDQRDGAEESAAGWAHCVGLTRNVWLSDDGGDIRVEPDPRLYSLLDEELLALEDVDMAEANRALEAVSGDMLYIDATFVPSGAESFGLTVKSNGMTDETTFSYDMAKRTIRSFTSNPGNRASGSRFDGFTSNSGKCAIEGHFDGSLPLKNGALRVEVFIDRSMVEAFFNGDKSISIRSYAERTSQNMFLFSDGDLRIHSIKVCRVNSIYV